MKFQFCCSPQLKIILAENVMGHEDVFEVQTIGQIGVHVFLPSGKSLAFVSAQYHAPNPRLEPPRQTQEKAFCYNMAGNPRCIRMSWEEAKQIALDRY